MYATLSGIYEIITDLSMKCLHRYENVCTVHTVICLYLNGADSNGTDKIKQDHRYSQLHSSKSVVPCI